eukprot:scaffold8427_cov19-Tisochrysis_lutea.AAC.1
MDQGQQRANTVLPPQEASRICNCQYHKETRFHQDAAPHNQLQFRASTSHGAHSSWSHLQCVLALVVVAPCPCDVVAAHVAFVLQQGQRTSQACVTLQISGLRMPQNKFPLVFIPLQ